MNVNFSDIPKHQSLFLDYLYEFENVKKYFNNDFRNKEKYFDIFNHLSEKERPHREIIADIIKEQYSNYSVSDLTKENIKKIKSNKTIAVVTGQQIGLFGGPLYTFYKIITTIKLCKKLQQQTDKFKFVPIFWMEGDDHDFNEIKSFNVISTDNNIINIKYDDEQPQDTNRGSVGNMTLSHKILDVLNELNNHIVDTEFKTDILNFLNSTYISGRTLSDAFKNLLFKIFDEYGLIIFNPSDAKVKEILKPIFKQEIENFRKYTDIIVNNTAELDDLYHAQVKINPVNLFYSDEEGRFLIEPVDDEFRLRNRRKRFSKQDILDNIETHPEKFSPNVLLRPICQDYLLPTAFYIAGPSEISYFAQLIPLYKIYNIIQPILYPRASITIVESKVNNFLSKYGLALYNLFLEDKILTNQFTNAIGEIDYDNLLHTTKNNIENLINDLKLNIQKLDKTLVGTVDNTLEKINQAIDYLKLKVDKSQETKFDTALRQLRRAKNILFPNNNLQEREINFIYFINKYSFAILKYIFDEINIELFEHQIIELS
ncbi:MAG: bacillithiol biosynthesis cysteine-adding enzyme BshC [Ignavibacteriales bacterium]|nr:bacillithiol biosynthesis cysteine-adding enzyme BshC [Ignavibacteriales bacterium]